MFLGSEVTLNKLIEQGKINMMQQHYTEWCTFAT